MPRQDLEMVLIASVQGTNIMGDPLATVHATITSGKKVVATYKYIGPVTGPEQLLAGIKSLFEDEL